MDVGASVIQLVKQNPVPAALVGLGLGWLYMNRSTGHPDYRAHSGSHYRYLDSYRSTDADGQSGYGGVARQTGERASAMASDVQEQVGDFTDAVMDRTTRAPGQVQQMMEENPIMTAALAAALGGAVGLAMPSTSTEDQLIGASRDRVMGRAQRMTSEAMDKVQNVAQEVQATATNEARSQGLTV